MQNLLEELKKLLEQDERLVVEGKLLKNKIIESALKLDVDLIRLLLKSETIKTHFFQEVDGVLVFDKIKFQKFVSNKAFLPDSYTSFKNKIGLVTENEEYLSESKKVVLAWPYKDCVLEGGMEKEDEKRDEIFYNEILAPDEIDRLLEPKVLTNFMRIDKNGEHKVQEIKRNDNLIIRGNNLFALHSLQKRFAGKVKLIYIDPPYNTGNDSFKYNDNFNHSSWITFMKNRLEVAKGLLKENGAIFVQCDDNEQAYLKVLLDEVFTRDNFVNTISLRVSPPEGVKTFHAKRTILKEKEYLHVFGKNKSKLSFTPQYVKADSWDSHYASYIKNKNQPMEKWEVIPLNLKLKEENLKPDLDSKNFVQWIIKNSDKIFQLIDAGKYKEEKKYKIDKFQYSDDKKILLYKGRKVHFLEEGLKQTDEGVTLSRLLCDFWKDISFNNLFQEGGVTLIGGKKPEKLIRRILSLLTQENDLVLDFNLGSGTTCAVAHKMKRQYIGIEQFDYGENDSVVRLKNVINGDQSGVSKSVNWQGGGDFIYCELMKLNEKYIDEIKKVETTKELIDIWKTMKEKAFLSYKVDVKKFDLPAATSTTQAGESVKEFEQLNIENQKKFLIECLDKNQLYVNLSEIDDSEYEISKEDKELNKQFYEVK